MNRIPRSAVIAFTTALWLAQHLAALHAADAPASPARAVPKNPAAIAGFKTEDRSAFLQRLEFKGVALMDDRYHFWCASPIWGPDGKVHLFASRWPVDKSKKNNDFWGLLTKCEIAHYVGDAPEGPFTFSDVALRGTGGTNWDSNMAHNPDIKQIGDQYVLTYTSRTDADASRHPAVAAGFADLNYRIGMAVSKSLNGPWERIGREGLVFGFDDGLGDKNWDREALCLPNPYLVQVPTGKFHLYYRATLPNRHFDIGVAIADRLEGPYTRQPTPLIGDGVNKEDPCVFIEGGKFYLLYHPLVKGDYSSIHESEDGIHFEQKPRLAIPPLNYYCGTKSEKGSPFPSYFAHDRLDEPKILLKDGKPSYIYLACGTNIKGGPGSCNYAFQIHDPAGRHANKDE